MVRPAALAAALVTLSALGACSGGDPPADEAGPTPTGSADAGKPAGDDTATLAEGRYQVTSQITRSTIDQNPAGSRSETERTVFFSCWESDCSTVAQRGDVTDMWLSQTFRLQAGEEEYTGTRVRSGVCTDTGDGQKIVKESYTETFTLSWVPQPDGSLEGEAVQEFAGCTDAKVRTAVYALTAEADGDAEDLPYLGGEEATVLTQTLNDFDQAAVDINEAYPACFGADIDVVQSAQCKAAAYRPWIESLRAVEEPMSVVRREAAGACREAIGGVDLTGPADVMERAARADAAVRDAAAAEAAQALDTRAVKAVTPLYGTLSHVATMCLPPEDFAELGDEGAMVLDITSSNIPPLDG